MTTENKAFSPEIVCLSDSSDADDDVGEEKGARSCNTMNKVASKSSSIDKDDDVDLEVLPAARFPTFKFGVWSSMRSNGDVAPPKLAKPVGPQRALCEKKLPPEEITLDDDNDDDKFEIEYSSDNLQKMLHSKPDKSDQRDKYSTGDTGVGRCETEDKRSGFPADPRGIKIGAESVQDMFGMLIDKCSPKSTPVDSEENVTGTESQVVLENGCSLDEAAKLCGEALEEFLVEFRVHAGSGKPRSIKEKIEKGIQKTREDYEELIRNGNTTSEVHLQLKEDIIAKGQCMKAVPGSSWLFLKEIKCLMQPANLVALSGVSSEEKKRARDADKAKLLKKFERELYKWNRRILKYETDEVHWSDDDDEHNSPYLLGDKCKQKLMRAFYALCDLSGCNRFTNRPIQKRISLKGNNTSSNYDDIDASLEKLVNKGGALFIPDFTDIHDDVQSVNYKSRLNLSAELIFHIAQEMFTKIVHLIKKRREKDFRMAMLSILPGIEDENAAATFPADDVSDFEIPAPADDDINMEHLSHRFQDPAEFDPELKEKLEDNEKLKKSEDQILDQFVKIAEEGTDDNNINGVSPQGSDSEANTDEDEEEKADHQKMREQQIDELVEEDEDEQVENCDVPILQRKISSWNGVTILHPDLVKRNHPSVPDQNFDNKNSETTCKSNDGRRIVPNRINKVLPDDITPSSNKKARLDSTDGTPRSVVPIPADANCDEISFNTSGNQ